jgi:hypothetical protein
MSIHNFVNLPRHSHEGRGLFVLGTSADANAAVARALQTAGIPKSSVLRAHLPHPHTARALVRSICEAAGLMIHPSMSLFHMTKLCLKVIQEKRVRILHIDELHSDVDPCPSKIDAELCSDLFKFLLKARGISLIINSTHRLAMFDGQIELIRRFRFLSASDLGTNEAAYLVRGV